jgi:hypothetical protein
MIMVDQITRLKGNSPANIERKADVVVGWIIKYIRTVNQKK